MCAYVSNKGMNTGIATLLAILMYIICYQQQPSTIIRYEVINANNISSQNEIKQISTQHHQSINLLGEYELCESLPTFPEYIKELQNKTNMNAEAIINSMMNKSNLVHINEEYIDLLNPYISCIPSQVIINENPFKLQSDEDIINLCKTGEHYFDGPRDKDKLPLIIDIFAYGYEAGLFEIRLKESYDIIDYFVVWESLYGQRLIRKPLYFEKSWHQRFKYLDPDLKVIHLIQDDVAWFDVYKKQNDSLMDGNDWRNEAIFRTEGFQKFLEIFNKNGDKTDMQTLQFIVDEYNKKHEMNIEIQDVIIITSDLDEILTYSTVAMLKYCKPKQIKFPINFKKVTFHRTIFDYVLSGKVKAKIEKAVDVINDDDEKSFNSYPMFDVIHITRGLNPFQDTLKELILAEGGSLVSNKNILDLEMPWKGQKEFMDKFGYGENDGDKLLIDKIKDPGISYFWLKNGLRSCCGIDTERRERDDKDPMLWFAVCNKQRFPYLFPSNCELKNFDEHPLDYKCKDDKVVDVKERCTYNVEL